MIDRHRRVEVTPRRHKDAFPPRQTEPVAAARWRRNTRSNKDRVRSCASRQRATPRRSARPRARATGTVGECPAQPRGGRSVPGSSRRTPEERTCGLVVHRPTQRYLASARIGPAEPCSERVWSRNIWALGGAAPWSNEAAGCQAVTHQISWISTERREEEKTARRVERKVGGLLPPPQGQRSRRGRVAQAFDDRTRVPRREGRRRRAEAPRTVTRPREFPGGILSSSCASPSTADTKCAQHRLSSPFQVGLQRSFNKNHLKEPKSVDVRAQSRAAVARPAAASRTRHFRALNPLLKR